MKKRNGQLEELSAGGLDSKDLRREAEDTALSMLVRSRIFRDYQESFTKATGLPLALRPPRFTTALFHDWPTANTFCRLMAKYQHTCQACLAVQQAAEREARDRTKTLECWAGLCETAIPVRNSHGLIGILQTGQVLLHQPCQRRFDELMGKLDRMGIRVNGDHLKTCYFRSRKFSQERYASIIQLLELFALHLASVSDQMLLGSHGNEPQAVSKAKEFIRVRFHKKLSLGQVAEFVHVSAGYFSEIFKKATGIGFVEYVNRLRVENAKRLLANPNLRISEIAFDVGFASLSQFNRSFKKLTGLSPTEFRANFTDTSPCRSVED